jgi:hypothetical protein
MKEQTGSTPQRKLSGQAKYEVTNKAWSASEQFAEMCKQANVKPTRRQASKYRNKKGSLYNFNKGV